jgi:hypothetical protein
MRSFIKLLVWNSEGKRTIGGHRCRWEANIEMEHHSSSHRPYSDPQSRDFSCCPYSVKSATWWRTQYSVYGCETWSLTIREEHTLRVFENRVLRIFGRKREEWQDDGEKKLHNEELRNLYSSPTMFRMIKSRRMRWTGHVARLGRRGILLYLLTHGAESFLRSRQLCSHSRTS